jgi:hypothetical protein
MVFGVKSTKEIVRVIGSHIFLSKSDRPCR